MTSAAPDRPFLALCHEVMARIAILKQDVQLAGEHLSTAISIVRHARLPHATWRVYRTTAALYAGLGQTQRAAKWRDRSGQVIGSLAETLDPGDPLRSASFFDAGRDTRLDSAER
ncbi:hypothetical protein ACVWWR_000586 [Bradyrhizobium sp. LM3.2]